MNSISRLLDDCTPSERLLVEHALKLVNQDEKTRQAMLRKTQTKAKALYELTESFVKFFPEVRDARWNTWVQDTYPSLFALKTGAELPDSYERTGR